MALIDKLTSIADAIRGKTGGTDPLTLDQMATEIAGIEAGGGGSDALELIYHTTFSLEESQIDVGKVNIATINTGLTKTDFGGENDIIVCIRCINDTDADTSYKHFKARTNVCFVSDGYGARVTAAGVNYVSNFKYIQQTSIGGVYVSAIGSYMDTITLAVDSNYATYGLAPSGDYDIRVYALKQSYFGIEGDYV